MRKWALVACALVFLGGCAAESHWAPDEEVARAAYRHDGPPRLTLYTMVNNDTGAGAHTSLMVNGSQRVVFDPAGSFRPDGLPIRNDVVYGMTPAVTDVYTRYHARNTYHVQIQTLDVSPELAERAMQAVTANGPVASAQCALSTSGILAGLFPDKVGRTWLPRRLAAEFGEIDGVTEEKLYEYDDDDNSKVLKEWDPTLVARADTTAD